MNDEELIAAAASARAHAYAPYSRYHVGAALVTKAGKVFTATNVENASYGLTICAERVAFTYAVSQGEREFRAIAVVTESAPPAFPCGACRQVLSELAPDLEVLCANLGGDVERTTMRALLPSSFSRESLLP
jgi:cytidine deaminase